jgi:hypothetical protein
VFYLTPSGTVFYSICVRLEKVRNVQRRRKCVGCIYETGIMLTDCNIHTYRSHVPAEQQTEVKLKDIECRLIKALHIYFTQCSEHQT